MFHVKMVSLVPHLPLVKNNMNLRDRTAGTRFFWIDLIRVVACYLVVLLHVLNPYAMSRTNFDANIEFWWLANFFRSCATVAVPLFFMISGHLLLGKEEPAKIFFMKRASKVAVPLLFWLFVYFGFKLYTGALNGDGGITMAFIRNAKNGSIHSHFWFLYVLISVYVVVPFLRKYISAANRANIEGLLCLWFVVHSLYGTINFIRPVSFYFPLEFATKYSGYFILGYYLGQREYSKSTSKWCFGGIVGFVLLSLFGTSFVMSTVNDSTFQFDNPPMKYPMEILYYPFAPNVILLASCVFIWFKCNTEKIRSKWFVQGISFLANLSFGVFLVHGIVMEIVLETIRPLVNEQEPLTVLLLVAASVIIFLCSALVTYVIRSLPMGKIVAP